MTRRWGLVLAALCVLPAQAASPTLPDAVVSVLTPIDSVPSRAALDRAFAPEPALAHLANIARDDAGDLGIQLRAIRALPAYCPPSAGTCGPDTPSHDTLVELILRYRDAADTTAQAPLNLLRLRAAAEALGATRSGLPEDLDVLLTLLGDEASNGHPSLDVRAAAAAAIGQLCNSDAPRFLLLHGSDPSPQVRAQITAALQRLTLCSR